MSVYAAALLLQQTYEHLRSPRDVNVFGVLLMGRLVAGWEQGENLAKIGSRGATCGMMVVAGAVDPITSDYLVPCVTRTTELLVTFGKQMEGQEAGSVYLLARHLAEQP